MKQAYRDLAEHITQLYRRRGGPKPLKIFVYCNKGRHRAVATGLMLERMLSRDFMARISVEDLTLSYRACECEYCQGDAGARENEMVLQKAARWWQLWRRSGRFALRPRGWVSLLWSWKSQPPRQDRRAVSQFPWKPSRRDRRPVL
jgi:hypothetical protein